MADEKEKIEPLNAFDLIWNTPSTDAYVILINRINWLTKKVQELEKKGEKDV